MDGGVIEETGGGEGGSGKRETEGEERWNNGKGERREITERKEGKGDERGKEGRRKETDGFRKTPDGTRRTENQRK